MGRKVGISILGLWLVLAMAGVAWEETPESGGTKGSGVKEAQRSKPSKDGVAQGQGKGKVFLRLDPGGHMAVTRDIFFLEGGRRLLSASDDKTIRIWDLSDLNHPQPFSTIRGEMGPGSFGYVYAMAPSPDGGLLAVGGYLWPLSQDPKRGSTIRLYDLKSGRVVGILQGHENTVADLVFSPKGGFLVSASADRTVILWRREGKNYRLYQKLAGHTDLVGAVAFSKDRVASGSNDHTVRLYDVKQDFKLLKVLREPEDKVETVQFSPDGQYLLTGAHDRRIRLYDREGNFIREFARQDTVPIRLSFSPDGRFVVAGSYGGAPNNVCYLYSFPEGKVIQAFQGHQNSVFAVAATLREGKPLLATAGGNYQEILLWDPEGRIRSRIEGVGQGILSVALAEDGRIGWGTTLRKQEPNHMGPLEYAFDTRGLILSPLPSEEDFRRGEVTRGEYELQENPSLSKEMGLLSPRSLLEVTEEGETRAQLIRHVTDGYRHTCYTFLNDRFLASGGMNGRLFVYNLRGEKVAELIGHEGEVWAVAATRDGQWLVSGSSDQTVRLWDVGGLQEVDWGEGEVDWKRLKAASLETYQEWYPYRDRLAQLRSEGPLTWQGLVNWLKSHYLPIRKLYPLLTLFPTREGQWVAWTPEGYFAASSPSAMRLVGYHLNRGFEQPARFVSFNQLYDAYFRPDLVWLKLNRPQEDLRRYTDLIRIEEALGAAPPPEVEIVSPGEGAKLSSEWITVTVRVRDTGGKIGDIRLYHNGKLAFSEGGDRVTQSGPPGILSAKAGDPTPPHGGSGLGQRGYRQDSKMPSLPGSTPLAGAIEKRYRLRLIAGENTLSCQAMNGKNTILSGMAQVKVFSGVK